MSVSLSSGHAEDWVPGEGIGELEMEPRLVHGEKTPQDLGTPSISLPPAASVSLCREIFLNNGTFSCFNQMQFCRQFL